MNKLHPVEVAKMKVEIETMKKNQQKLDREIFWYPVAIATGIIMAVAAVLKVLENL